MQMDHYQRVVKLNFERINQAPFGSTSKIHRALHKIWTQYRVKNGVGKDVLGDLRWIASEVGLGNSVCGDPSYPLNHGVLWSADSIERIKVNGSNIRRTIEVLTNYPKTFLVENTKEGRDIAERFSEYMLEQGYFDESIADNFGYQISLRHIGNFDEVKIKYMHFWILDRYTNGGKTVDYGEFAPHVDKLTEIERKWRAWNRQTDTLAFVINERDQKAFTKDYEKFREKHPEIDLGIEFIASIQENHFGLFLQENEGLTGLYEVEDLMEVPRELKGESFFDLEILVDKPILIPFFA